MLRFSVRDLFWATLVVAIVLACWLRVSAVEANRQKTIRGAQDVFEHARKLKHELAIAKKECDQQDKDVKFYMDASMRRGASFEHVSMHFAPDWGMVDEPIPAIPR